LDDRKDIHPVKNPVPLNLESVPYRTGGGGGPEGKSADPCAPGGGPEGNQLTHMHLEEDLREIS